MATTEKHLTPEDLIDRWRSFADLLEDEADAPHHGNSEGERRVAARQRGKALGLRKAADDLDAMLRTQ